MKEYRTGDCDGNGVRVRDGQFDLLRKKSEWPYSKPMRSMKEDVRLWTKSNLQALRW